MTAENIRTVFFWFVMGINGTGKSVTILEAVAAMKQAKTKDKIVCFDPQDRFIHVRDEVITKESLKQEGWKKYFGYTNTLFVLDDFKELIGGYQTDEDLMALFSQRRENGNDFIVIAWHPNLILQGMSYFITKYFIFKLGSSEKALVSDKIEAAETVGQIATIVRKYTKIHGGGEYPKFPHAVVDSIDGKASFVNMPKISIVKTEDGATVKILD